MKNVLIIMLISLFMSTGSDGTKAYKPYILGAKSNLSIAETINKVTKALNAQQLTVEGVYQPAWDANRTVICFSSPELIAAAKKNGGLTGFSATLRIGITKNGSTVDISYTNPFYWGNAYYRDDYPKVESEYIAVYNKLIRAMNASGTFVGKYFGSAKGIDIDDLREYQYMMGMPEFDDVVILKKFDSYASAVAKIDANLKLVNKNYKLVYATEIPGKNLKLYGIALTGDSGEKLFMPTIDISTPKHTAFLPYEILVNDNQVVMLHGRYRIALSFPDLTMGTFTKIMSAPGNIEDYMKEVCK